MKDHQLIDSLSYALAGATGRRRVLRDMSTLLIGGMLTVLRHPPASAQRGTGARRGRGDSHRARQAGKRVEAPRRSRPQANHASAKDGRAARADAGWWRPEPGLSWQIQFGEAVDLATDVQVFDLDLYDTPQDTIATLQARGTRVICYFSAGTHEDWRPDQDQFPAEAIGRPLADWPGERWLDYRHEGVRTLMLARMDLAVEKGCDALDLDNVDAYAAREATGFPLSPEDQLVYNRFLATNAHERGLGIGLKNDLGQIGELVDVFDFEVNESCLHFNECQDLQPFLDAGKPVYQIEYIAPKNKKQIRRTCRAANALGLQTLIKHVNLDGWRIDCSTMG